MSKAATLFIFGCGVVVGMSIGFRMAKSVYEEMAAETEQPVEEDDSIDILDNSEIINENSYASSDETNDKPYVIPPEEFGEMEGYVQSSLTYYADRVLTDEDDNVIDDVDGIVGADFYKHFGEYEEDSVFVRNDGKKHDYEILKDFRLYSDVVKNNPHLSEG